MVAWRRGMTGLIARARALIGLVMLATLVLLLGCGDLPDSAEILAKPVLPSLRCPACSEALEAIPSADPFAAVVACARDHRFHVLPEGPEAYLSAQAGSFGITVDDGASDRQIIEYWLADPDARRLLNVQLAEILRSIGDARNGRSVADRPRFSSCPYCATALEQFDQPDIWVLGLRCEKGHEFAQRGGRLWASGQGSTERLELRAELSSSELRDLTAGWLEGDRHMDAQLHPSVERVLRRFLTDSEPPSADPADP